MINYKKIFDYDNFYKHKLKYIIVILLISIVAYILYSYFKQKYNHKHYENFQNNILLGTSNNNLSDVIDENKTLKITCYNNISTSGNTFISYKAIDKSIESPKYLGDLIYDLSSSDINNFTKQTLENQHKQDEKKHLIHILNPSSNINSLTDNDKKDKNAIILNESKSDSSSYNLFKYMGFVNNNNDLNLNIKKIHKFLTNKSLDNSFLVDEFEQKNCDNYNNNNLFNEIIKLSKEDNKDTLAQYQKTLITIQNSFSENFKKKIDDLIEEKIDELSGGNDISIIPCGYNFNSSDGNSIDFPLKKYDTKDNINNFYKTINENTSISIETKNNIIMNSKIVIEEIKINEIIIMYSFLLIDDNSFTLRDPLNDNSVEEIYNYEFNEILKKLNYYLTIISDITKMSSINDLDIPIQFIRTKIYNDKTDNKSDDENQAITFGDILYTGYNDFPNKLLNNYVKVPLRCCRKIEQTYNDLEPIFEFTEIDSNKTYQIFKHPLYNTFRVFEKDGDNIEKSLPLYEIIPCVEKITKYHEQINKYTKLKDKCNQQEQITDNSNNSFNKLQTAYKRNEIKDNEKVLNQLRTESNKLQKEINRKNIVKTEYNRAKLQNYNNQKSIQINQLTKKLSNNNMDINIYYSESVIKLLKQKCLAGELSFCKKNNKVKKGLINKLETIEKEIENSKKKPDKNKKNDKKIKQQLLEIINECPNLDNMIHKDELNKCYQCNL